MAQDEFENGVGQDEASTYANEPRWFEADIPEFFADTVNINTSPYGNSITFGIRGFQGPRPNARIFMSHELAFVLSGLLRRILLTYEQENDVRIQIPPSVATELKLRDEDFRQLLPVADSANDPKTGKVHDGD